MRNPEEQTAMEIAALLHDQPFFVSHDIRNIRTLFRRFRNEGFSFLSKTLPTLGKCFDQALSGNVAFSLPTSFKRFKKTCFPHFLGSALRRVFDANGLLLECPCYQTITFIRSILYYAYKIEVPFKENEIQEFSKKFVETDQQIGDFAFCGDVSTQALRNLMRVQLADLHDRQDKPAFGPGISSNCRREDKYNVFTPPSEMRNHFGREFFHMDGEHSYEYAITFVVAYWHGFLGYESEFTWGSFEPSKVLFVPKDSRGPRTICCEDSRRMYAQKSLQKNLYRQIEQGSRFGGRVNFTDQSINQNATFDSNNATLDLKDASDRISLDLVIDVFPPKLVASFIACRSDYARLPDGQNIRLEKFAPMGSALCFPVMALIAYTAVTSAIYLAGGTVPSHQNAVYVYGDDIIVPNEYAEVAMSALESVGLLVNRAKSFVNSRFRESCGQDTLDHASVMPLRKKRFLFKPIRKRYKNKQVLDDTNGGYPHCVSLINAARKKRYYNLASCLTAAIESEYGKLPYGVHTSSYACIHVDDEDVHCFNKAAGYEVNGKLRAFVIRDKELNIKFKDANSRLRRDLLEGGTLPGPYGSSNVFDPTKIGARSTFLQHKSLVKWGSSYS